MPSTSLSTQPAHRLCAILLTLAIMFAASATARAAEINVLSASALKIIVAELAVEFSRETGHTSKLGFATAGEVERRVLANEAVDVVIATDVQIGRLAEKGLVVPSSRAVIASVGVGIGVKDGAPKPDITSAEALKTSLLAAKSIAYPDPAKGGASGVHFAAVIDRLGIAEAIKAKAVLGANPDFVCVSVAKGDVELCAHQISEIMPVTGVTLVGPLPREMQKVTTFVVAASQGASAPEAALAFAQFLARPALKAKFAAAGLAYKID